jgi:hypothetical protein
LNRLGYGSISEYRHSPTMPPETIRSKIENLPKGVFFSDTALLAGPVRLARRSLQLHRILRLRFTYAQKFALREMATTP